LKLTIEPLTRERWADLVALFSRPGLSVARGCWCTYYRYSGRRELPAGMTYSARNRRDLEATVERGIVPGLLGYDGGDPVGWVSLGPREDFARLARSSVMKPVDEKPVWSIICFVVDPRLRHRGVARAMLAGALAWARAHGVTLIEAYPCERTAPVSDDAMWFGAKSMFDREGFVEVARRKPGRPVMRKTLRPATKRR
jgi:GNAT superfamily N-acetyltransferase